TRSKRDWSSDVCSSDLPGWGPFDALRLTFELNAESDTLEGLADVPLVRAARRLDLHYGYFLHTDQPPEVMTAAGQEPSLREMRQIGRASCRERVRGAGA